MDISFSDADLAFRNEVREFLAEAWDEELQGAFAYTERQSRTKRR